VRHRQRHPGLDLVAGRLPDPRLPQGQHPVGRVQEADPGAEIHDPDHRPRPRHYGVRPDRLWEDRSVPGTHHQAHRRYPG